MAAGKQQLGGRNRSRPGSSSGAQGKRHANQHRYECGADHAHERVRSIRVSGCLSRALPRIGRVSRHAEIRGEFHYSGPTGRDYRCVVAGEPDDHASRSPGRRPVGDNHKPYTRAYPRAAAYRTTAGERQELSSVPGDRAWHRFYRDPTSVRDAHEHVSDAFRRRSGQRSLGRMGFRPCSRFGCSPGVARRDE